jgi:hypothetical protein
LGSDDLEDNRLTGAPASRLGSIAEQLVLFELQTEQFGRKFACSMGARLVRLGFLDLEGNLPGGSIPTQLGALVEL